MSDPHPLRCRCGTLKGYVGEPGKAARAVCYCRDCQAFAHFLGKQDEILDAMNGSDVVATLPARVTFTEGQDRLACMSLSETGMLRWYASCCNTAIGNTPRDFRTAHVGLLHTCLDRDGENLDADFGPVRIRLSTKNANGKARAMPVSTAVSMLRFIRALLAARLSGRYKNTPFFVAESGLPVAAPTVLSAAERDRLTRATGLQR